MRRFRLQVAGVLVGVALVSTFMAVPAAQNPATQIAIAVNNLVTGVTVYTRERFIAGGYINWGSGTDSAGYGFRDLAGVIQWKNLGGSWANVGTGGGGGGAPDDASYWVRVATGGLTNETIMANLGTGLVKNTTTTGVPSIAVAADVIGLWSGSCSGSTALGGNGTCLSITGGAPSTATYLTQIPDATLSAEQALSLLTTGLMKVTTSTGVVSTAVVGDVLALFTGTCNGSTVLAGNGTCITVSGGGGAPTTATYITQIPDAGLSAEQALSALATGLVKVTTATGVLSSPTAADIISYFSGTCNGSTVLAGNGPCVAAASAGAPTNATYLTQTPNGSLSNEQAMSALSTGLMKVTTGTGVVSSAVVADLLSYFTGTCNSATVLTGAGTCVGLSTAFSVITSATNTAAAMVIGTGASLATTGSGTITATTMVPGSTIPSPIVTGLLDISPTGVRLTAADGVLTLLGLGNGNDESLTIDLDNATANQVNIATGTGVTQVNWSMILQAGGYKSSDGTAGLTQTCVAAVTAVTVKNGLITAITCP